jgi:glutaredoxin-related protein
VITKEQAQDYIEQLHPAFAGYLHDGIVSERDAIAAVMNLVQKSLVKAAWEDGSMCRNIKSLSKTSRIPQLGFDRKLIEIIFAKQDKVDSGVIKKLIQNGVISNAILNNLSAIQTFPIIYNDVEFNHGDDVIIPFLHRNKIVDSFSEIRTFDRDIKLTLLLIFAFTILVLGRTRDVVDIPLAIVKLESYDISILSITLLSLLFAFSTLYYSFISSKKQVSYQFEKNVIPIAQKKYSELFDFLSNYPLENHNIVNEFLPFSIAFGIDKSWLGDFGLSAEPKIEGSPLIDY